MSYFKSTTIIILCLLSIRNNAQHCTDECEGVDFPGFDFPMWCPDYGVPYEVCCGTEDQCFELMGLVSPTQLTTVPTPQPSVTSISTTLEAWQTTHTTIPSTRAGCGYNDKLSMVYIVGISDETGEYNLISYNASSDNIIAINIGGESLSYGGGSGQNYVSTSTGDILYLQDYNIGRLVIGIGSDAPSIIYPVFTQEPVFTQVEGKRACIAISGDNNYIFVVGGSPTGSASNKVNRFLVYDIINKEWFNGPNMNIIRGNHACSATNNYLYVFGGDYKGKKDSIEKIDISSIDNIKYKLNKWNIISSKLTQARNGLHAIKFYEYIYIIGGNDIYGEMVTDVDRFDTVNDMIYSDISLPVGLRPGCVTAVQNKLYVFGGISNGVSINNIYWTQIIDPCNGNCASNEICVNGECKLDCV